MKQFTSDSPDDVAIWRDPSPITSGREAAGQSAAASAASFFLPFFTKGLIASGAINFTSCPRPISMRAQWCAAPQAKDHRASLLLLEERDQLAPS
jgi:hypothetical protein